MQHRTQSAIASRHQRPLVVKPEGWIGRWPTSQVPGRVQHCVCLPRQRHGPSAHHMPDSTSWDRHHHCVIPLTMRRSRSERRSRVTAPRQHHSRVCRHDPDGQTYHRILSQILAQPSRRPPGLEAATRSTKLSRTRSRGRGRSFPRSDDR
jgi:hypothetical protein